MLQNRFQQIRLKGVRFHLIIWYKTAIVYFQLTSQFRMTLNSHVKTIPKALIIYMLFICAILDKGQLGFYVGN